MRTTRLSFLAFIAATSMVTNVSFASPDRALRPRRLLLEGRAEMRDADRFEGEAKIEGYQRAIRFSDSHEREPRHTNTAHEKNAAMCRQLRLLRAPRGRRRWHCQVPHLLGVPRPDSLKRQA